MGVSRKYFLIEAKEKENEDWINGLTLGNTNWEGMRMENRSSAYLWGSCVRDALKAKRLLCDFEYEYNFGSRDFQGLLDAANKFRLLGDL
jgi:hypothetical protein